MPLPSFSDGQTLTAAALNALIDKLNLVEKVVSTLAPAFHQVGLDSQDYAGTNGGAERNWYYAFLHQDGNRYLHYRYEWFQPQGGPDLTIWVPNGGAPGSPTPYYMPVTPGVTIGYIDLQPRAIPVGVLYVVRVEADRGTSGWFKLNWLFERSYA